MRPRTIPVHADILTGARLVPATTEETSARVQEEIAGEWLIAYSIDGQGRMHKRSCREPGYSEAREAAHPALLPELTCRACIDPWYGLDLYGAWSRDVLGAILHPEQVNDVVHAWLLWQRVSACMDVYDPSGLMNSWCNRARELVLDILTAGGTTDPRLVLSGSLLGEDQPSASSLLNLWAAGSPPPISGIEARRELVNSQEQLYLLVLNIPKERQELNQQLTFLLLGACGDARWFSNDCVVGTLPAALADALSLSGQPVGLEPFSGDEEVARQAIALFRAGGSSDLNSAVVAAQRLSRLSQRRS